MAGVLHGIGETTQIITMHECWAQSQEIGYAHLFVLRWELRRLVPGKLTDADQAAIQWRASSRSRSGYPTNF